MHIVVDVESHRLAYITLFYDEKPAITRKHRLKNVDQQKANELVIVFCTLLNEGNLRDSRYESEEDTTDFFVDVIRDTLKEVHTKLGLLIWRSGQ